MSIVVTGSIAFDYLMSFPGKFTELEAPGAQPGDKEVPEPSGMPAPHRHPPAVPVVEVADQADPPRIRRPHGEGEALDPVMAGRRS